MKALMKIIVVVGGLVFVFKAQAESGSVYAPNGQVYQFDSQSNGHGDSGTVYAPSGQTYQFETNTEPHSETGSVYAPNGEVYQFESQ